MTTVVVESPPAYQVVIEDGAEHTALLVGQPAYQVIIEGDGEIATVETPRYEVLVEGGGEQTVITETPAYEVVVATEGVQGPPGPAGPAGPAGPPGPSGAVQEQSFTFASAAAAWQATHSLPLARPGVFTFDNNGALVEGDVSFPGPNTVRVEWAWPMAGTMTLTT